MIIETTRYARTPFYVEAVQVSLENMAAVAAWCKGEITRIKGEAYVKVEVLNPLNERQTKAFVGDWVLLAETGNGFKVYTNKAFQNNFQVVDGTVLMHTVEEPSPDNTIQEAMSFVDVEPGIPAGRIAPGSVLAQQRAMAKAFEAERHVNRNAVNGEFVTEEYADNNPTTTVKETVSGE